MNKTRVFQPGDLIKLNFDPSVGHEQAGWRPALIVSEAAYNSRSGLALVCPVTSQVKGYPFEVPLPRGLPVQGVVLSDQIKSIDLKSRNAKFVGGAPEEILELVRSYIALILRGK